jgi:hypothetical protein
VISGAIAILLAAPFAKQEAPSKSPAKGETLKNILKASPLESNSQSKGRRPELNAVSTQPRHRFACHPSPAPRKEGISTFFSFTLFIFFFYPLCGEAGEGDPAKRRPGESTVNGIISLQSLIAVFS